MCVQVCKRFFIPFIVSPLEADMQAGQRNKSAIPVCRDSDLLAYGNKKVIIMDSYFKQEARVFDMTVPVTEEIEEQYPLYAYLHKYGIVIIHWWAAVMGCDISVDSSGIRNVGPKAFFKALESFNLGDAVPPRSSSFAKAIREASKPEVRFS